MNEVNEIPRRPDWHDPNYKDIVRDRVVFRESLPLPWVSYPRSFGTWINFQAGSDAQPYLCSCFKQACLNFLELNEQRPVFRLSRDSTLINHFLSVSPATNCLQANTKDEFDAVPLFKERLCHLCNRRVPQVRWSNNESTSVFVQHFGWYWQIALYASGVSPFGDVLYEKLDSELRACVEVESQATRECVWKLLDQPALSLMELASKDHAWFEARRKAREEARGLQERLCRQRCRLGRVVEERLRRSLGFPPHGKTGNTEIILRWIVAALFPDKRIEVKCRPRFLEGLEFDIYLPDLQLAIEYQGEQHYEAFEHLGGALNLEAVIKRDRRKRAISEQLGIKLIYFTPADCLTEEHVAKKLGVDQIAASFGKQSVSERAPQRS